MIRELDEGVLSVKSLNNSILVTKSYEKRINGNLVSATMNSNCDAGSAGFIN